MNHKKFFRIVVVLIVLGLVFVFFFGSFTRQFFAGVRVPVDVGNGIAAVAKVDRVKVDRALVPKAVVRKVVVSNAVNEVSVVDGVVVEDHPVVLG
jgi:hypothetical protein